MATFHSIGTLPTGIDRLRADLLLSGSLAVQRAVLGFQAQALRDPVARLFTPAGRRDPYALYADIRGRGRLVRTSLPFRATADHATCDAVLRDRTFSVKDDSNTRPTVTDLSLLELDPPDHTRLRRVVAPVFSPRVMKAQRPAIEAMVSRLLDDLETRDGPFDLVASFASPLPIGVITSLLGIPDAEASTFNRYGNAIGGALDGLQSVRHSHELQEARTALDGMFERLFADRRKHPADDVLTGLVRAQEDERVRPDELTSLCNLLLVAGFETTVNLLGNAVLALTEEPQRWERLAADPSLAPAVMVETLRYDGPVQLTGRFATTACEVAGQRLKPGDAVLVLLAGANRDPQVFDRPDEFDIDRPNNADHLAFSSGIHHCVGRPLAELEATIALEQLATRFPRLRRHGPYRRRNGTTLRGPLTLPVIA